MREAARHCDTVLRGGEVIDPAQGLWGIRDVGIAGGRIAMVEGSPQNIKVTTPDDWRYLEWRLSHD